MGLCLPKPNFVVPGLSPTVHATCTFFGGSCYSCSSDSQKHSLNDAARCFLLGDEFCPMMAGINNDCCPTLRIQGASFNDLKLLINKHVSVGLRIKPGSVGIVLLHTHLAKIGYHAYWSQLKVFTEWAASLNLNILPCIPPFPVGTTMSHLISVKQLLTHLQVGHFWNPSGSKNEAYSLWSALTSTLKKHCSSIGTVFAPAISIPEAGHMYASCEGQFCLGCEGDWSAGIPRSIEETFLVSLISSLSTVIESLSPIITVKLPSTASIIAGVKASSQTDVNSGKSIYLLGSSMMSDIKPYLQELCQSKGIQVISNCKSGKFLEHLLQQDLSFLSTSQKDDILFIGLLGNEMLNKQTHWADYNSNGQRTFHLLNPAILSDQDMDNLVYNIDKLITQINYHFKGRIFLVGAFPRHLQACCGLQAHAILDKFNQFISMVGYTKLFNTYLQHCLELPEGTEFLDFQSIIGYNTFSSRSLVDGVHLTNNLNKSCANFFVGALQRKPRARKERAKAELKFTAFLETKGLLTAKPNTPSNNSGSLIVENAMDEAIKLIM